MNIHLSINNNLKKIIGSYLLPDKKELSLDYIKSFNKTYKTHDNGGRPFKVKIGKNVDVYHNYGKYLIASYKPIRIFIGKSLFDDMTAFSRGHGKKFDGNSILLQIGNNKYIQIGWEIFSFNSLTDIKEFYSPIGNNDVPYPYAIDINDNNYMLIENVIVKIDKKLLKNNENIYQYYYENEKYLKKEKLETEIIHCRLS